MAFIFGLGRITFHDHEKLAHYANAAADIEFNFPLDSKKVFTLELILI
jgi:glycyl-tRNA synthetase